MHVAAEFGTLEVFKLIFDGIKEKNPENKYGITPFDLAKRHRNAEIARLIYEKDKHLKHKLLMKRMKF